MINITSQTLGHTGSKTSKNRDLSLKKKKHRIKRGELLYKIYTVKEEIEFQSQTRSL